MKNTSQKIKIGLFTLIGILLFVAGIFLIGSKKNMFGNTFMIYGTFKNVGGLEVGNNIRFAGINVGTVEDIRIISDTTIRVDMLMKEGVRPFLKADALASIGSDGLMGDKLITIASGSANEVRILSKGGQIRTINPIDFDKVISQFTNVADNAEVITHELAGMVVQIRTGKGTINKLLYTDDLSKSLEATAHNAKAITGSLADVASHIQSGKGSVGSLIYTDSFSNALESAGIRANAAMSAIQEGALGFSENMKALQGNYFLKGYFKRKAKKELKEQAQKDTSTTTDMDNDINEEELEAIIAEAQKALEAKRKNNER